MSKITIKAEDVAVTVIGRNIATGNDGEAVTIQPGKSATIEIDNGNQAVVALAAASGEPSSGIPHTAAVEQAKPEDELKAMTNKQLKELAAAEGTAVESDDNKDALVSKILAGRAARAL